MPPPAPNTVARPTTLGACQVRLQLSMLLLPMTDAGELLREEVHLVGRLRAAEDPERVRSPCRSTASRNPAAARSSASSQVAGRSTPSSRTSGSVSRVNRFLLAIACITSLPSGVGKFSRSRRVDGPETRHQVGDLLLGVAQRPATGARRVVDQAGALAVTRRPAGSGAGRSRRRSSGRRSSGRARRSPSQNVHSYVQIRASARRRQVARRNSSQLGRSSSTPQSYPGPPAFTARCCGSGGTRCPGRSCRLTASSRS